MFKFVFIIFTQYKHIAYIKFEKIDTLKVCTHKNIHMYYPVTSFYVPLYTSTNVLTLTPLQTCMVCSR